MTFLCGLNQYTLLQNRDNSGLLGTPVVYYSLKLGGGQSPPPPPPRAAQITKTWSTIIIENKHDYMWFCAFMHLINNFWNQVHVSAYRLFPKTVGHYFQFHSFSLETQEILYNHQVQSQRYSYLIFNILWAKIHSWSHIHSVNLTGCSLIFPQGGRGTNKAKMGHTHACSVPKCMHVILCF